MKTKDPSTKKWTILSTATDDCLASLHNDHTGERVRLDWSSLQPHWSYASPEDVDFCSADVVDDFLVLCLTTAGGQGGIAAIWNLSSASWTQISYAPFILACLPLLDLKVVFCLSFVDNLYSSEKRGYRLDVEPLDSSILPWLERSKEINFVKCDSLSRDRILKLGRRFVLDPSLTDGALVGLFHDSSGQKIFIYDENNLTASTALDFSIFNKAHS